MKYYLIFPRLGGDRWEVVTRIEEFGGSFPYPPYMQRWLIIHTNIQESQLPSLSSAIWSFESSMEEGADESSALVLSAGHEVLSALFLRNKFYKINATSLTGKSHKNKGQRGWKNVR